MGKRLFSFCRTLPPTFATIQYLNRASFGVIENQAERSYFVTTDTQAVRLVLITGQSNRTTGTPARTKTPILTKPAAPYLIRF